MVSALFRLGSTNSIFSSRISIMGEVIKFPNKRERVGKKYRQEEIARLNELLRLCDEDMKTVLEQIEQLQEELQGLTVEYEVMLSRLKELIEVEND
jgi:hypothetical protein